MTTPTTFSNVGNTDMTSSSVYGDISVRGTGVERGPASSNAFNNWRMSLSSGMLRSFLGSFGCNSVVA